MVAVHRTGQWVGKGYYSNGAFRAINIDILISVRILFLTSI